MELIMPEKVNMAQKFASFSDLWNPKIVGEVNDCFVKVVKLRGEFMWHHHENEDELFLVTKGLLRMKLRDAAGAEREERIGEGEFLMCRAAPSICRSATTKSMWCCSSPRRR
jgi:mannose-6-phosphate isomerase-like protein (cupin superfamily)